MHPASNISICVTEPLVCLRVAGRANFNCSADFKRVILALHQQGRRRFVVDLSECQLMDSTFLGVLIGLVTKPPPPPPNQPPLTLEILHPNQRIKDQFDNLNVTEFFPLADPAQMPPAVFQPAEIPGETPTKQEMTRVSLEAHQALMDASPANIPRFKDVVQFLAEDLKKTAPPSQ